MYAMPGNKMYAALQALLQHLHQRSQQPVKQQPQQWLQHLRLKLLRQLQQLQSQLLAPVTRLQTP